jgi:hypothetical protein
MVKSICSKKTGTLGRSTSTNSRKIKRNQIGCKVSYELFYKLTDVTLLD